MSVVQGCPGCGLVAGGDGPAPDGYRASAGCYAVLGQVLARDYADPEYYRLAHQIVVDAYTVQHAGGTGRREVQAVGLCLMTLCLFVEDGVPPARGPDLHRRMVARRPDFVALAPPPSSGSMTVADLLPARTAAEHGDLALSWGTRVWRAWAAHHDTVRAWNAFALSDGPPRRHGS